MQYNEENSDFFGYYGVIKRKNYAINMSVIIVLLVLSRFINVDALTRFTDIEFIKIALSYMIAMFQFVLVFSAISLVYRRFADISSSKSPKFKSVLKYLYAIFFIFPIFYFLILRYFFDIIPGFTVFADLFSFFVVLPGCLLLTVLAAFIKS